MLFGFYPVENSTQYFMFNLNLFGIFCINSFFNIKLVFLSI